MKKYRCWLCNARPIQEDVSLPVCWQCLDADLKKLWYKQGITAKSIELKWEEPNAGN